MGNEGCRSIGERGETIIFHIPLGILDIVVEQVALI